MITDAGVHWITGKDHPYEDRYRLLGAQHPRVHAAGRGHLYAVMDGVGGAPMGMRAAQLVADRLPEFFERDGIPATEEGLGGLLADVSREVFGWGMVEAGDRPLGAAAATVAWFCPSRRKLVVLHVGDTAALWFDGEELRPITHEHGEGRALRRYVGQGDGFRSDRHEVAMEEGDLLCLVTDGVTRALRVHDLREVLAACAKPQDAAKEIATRARSRGSRDDITAIVVALEEW